MDIRHLGEARFFGIGIRAYKPRPRPKSLAEQAGEEYARRYCQKLMKPHHDQLELCRRPKCPPRSENIELTPELEVIAKNFLANLNRGESVSSHSTAYGGSAEMRRIIGDITIYGSCVSHWGNGRTELTVFKGKGCIFACVFHFGSSKEIEILSCQNDLEELKQPKFPF